MKFILERWPWLEVQVRKCSAKLSFLKSIYKALRKKKKQDTGKQEQVAGKELVDYLKSLGIKKGDILIVHSSYRPLKCFGMKPNEIIEMLKEIIGSEGTLVMPSFALFPEEISGTFDETSHKQFIYDVNSSEAWTGIITDLFWREEDVVRSHYPDNPLAAWGKYSTEMFAEEEEGDLALGPNSAWKFCAEHNAKVLFLGVPALDSITEIHLPEDNLDKDWPVKGWFKERHYKIVDGEKETERNTRIRKQFWSKYATEFRCSYVLRKQGVLKEELFHNVAISYIPDLKVFEEFITQRALQGDLLIYKVPSKYYRKRNE